MLAVFTQSLKALPADRAQRLDQRLRAEVGVGLEVYALVYPDYQPPIAPLPQQNRQIFKIWQDAAKVPLWAWANATPEQGKDANAIRSMDITIKPHGWMLDIEGHWMHNGVSLATLLNGVATTSKPVRVSLAAISASHLETDYRTMDALNMPIDWQSYFDTGEGPRPVDAVRELYRSTFVIGGWQYRFQFNGKYGWGRVTDVRVVSGQTRAYVDLYRVPRINNAYLIVTKREWGWSVAHGGAIFQQGVRKGLLMGRCRYPLIRVTLDVTRGAAESRSLAEWTAIAGSARYPGSAKRPVSVYMAEDASDDVLVAIAKGAYT